MIIYELEHLFFRYRGELYSSRKSLGIFDSYESTLGAMEYYASQPGFRDNLDAFSIRELGVIGKVENNTVFWPEVYLYTEDYDYEETIDLGLYGNELEAQAKVDRYCEQNIHLIRAKNLLCDTTVGKCVIGRKEWIEGFTVGTE